MGSVVERLLQDKAVTWFKSKGSGGNSSWVIKALMTIAMLSFLAYSSYTAYKRNKELARLKHARDVAYQEATRAEKSWEIGVVDAKIEEKLRILEEAKVKSAMFFKHVADLEAEHTYERFKIESIKNWDDMDAYLSGIGGK